MRSSTTVLLCLYCVLLLGISHAQAPVGVGLSGRIVFERVLNERNTVFLYDLRTASERRLGFGSDPVISGNGQVVAWFDEPALGTGRAPVVYATEETDFRPTRTTFRVLAPPMALNHAGNRLAAKVARERKRHIVVYDLGQDKEELNWPEISTPFLGPYVREWRGDTLVVELDSKVVEYSADEGTAAATRLTPATTAVSIPVSMDMMTSGVSIQQWYGATLSPDGTRVAYVAIPTGEHTWHGKDGVWAVFLYDNNTSSVMRLTRTDMTTGRSTPVWAGNAKLLFSAQECSSERTIGSSSIYAVDLSQMPVMSKLIDNARSPSCAVLLTDDQPNRSGNEAK